MGGLGRRNFQLFGELWKWGFWAGRVFGQGSDDGSGCARRDANWDLDKRIMTDGKGRIDGWWNDFGGN
jgi:hypothetical protein